jgi:hypothetical protein
MEVLRGVIAWLRGRTVIEITPRPTGGYEIRVRQ